jgi:hypothetical protein
MGGGDSFIENPAISARASISPKSCEFSFWGTDLIEITLRGHPELKHSIEWEV